VNISSEQIIKQESNNRIRIPFTPRNNFSDDFREFFEHFDQFFIIRRIKGLLVVMIFLKSFKQLFHKPPKPKSSAGKRKLVFV
jgi:hypothetical protein